MIVDIYAPGSGACKLSAATEIPNNLNLEVSAVKLDGGGDDGNEVIETAVDFETEGTLKFPVWYNPNSITSTEKDYLHNLLTNPNYNSDNYLQSRNFIISLYELNPSIYLSATDCRRKMAGDVCSIVKIHDFLDSFGIINHSVLPEMKPRQVAISYLCTDIYSPLAKYSGKNTDRDYVTAIDDDDFVGAVVAHNFNWGDIEVAYRTLLAGSSVSSVTAEMCFSRFLRIELDKHLLQSQIKLGDGISFVNVEDALSSSSGIEGTAAGLRLVARGLAKEAATVFSKEIVSARARKMLASLLASSPSALGKDSLELGIVRVASAARLTLEKLVERVEGFLDDYIRLRHHVVEEKVTLQSDTDEMLWLDHLQPASEKRDAEVERARFAVGLNQQESRSAVNESPWRENRSGF